MKVKYILLIYSDKIPLHQKMSLETQERVQKMENLGNNYLEKIKQKDQAKMTLEEKVQCNEI